MPEGWHFSPQLGGTFVCNTDTNRYALTLRLLTELLASQGLRVVTEAEGKVLDACAAVKASQLDTWRHYALEPEARALWEAELARRGGR